MKVLKVHNTSDMDIQAKYERRYGPVDALIPGTTSGPFPTASEQPGVNG